ncbi:MULTISPECIES: acetyl-CoA carboxylase biotin carboxyl carrier protein subunit [Clostridium]|uniref:Biotin/lipoyl attachment domain-containing protein n=2 Tax=Clostridium TaxID=1485 RepID=A0A0E3K4I9_CLOSL|nr:MULTISPECIES: acetyl-CoA carboxylase biotin carboxyl carrier protein subunit [Clostridium]AKA72420.1 biotin/lipoyl attachment domain-containing protein [Clostridium scatologenes]AWI06446.1 acetyl-CoA carboxylase biotin carboxyl carrier protein subunit [Clostridium drakei]
MANLISPMTGKVLEINIKVGQEITDEDAELFIIEAMKMENTVSGVVGTVKEIKANVGDIVHEDDVIAIIE